LKLKYFGSLCAAMEAAHTSCKPGNSHPTSSHWGGVAATGSHV